MTQASIQVALDARLATLTGFADAATAWPNKPFSPVPGTAYLAPTTTVNQRPGGAGVAGFVYWEGVYRIVASFPSAKGTAALLARLDAIRTHFKRGTTLTTSDNWSLIFEVPRSGVIGRDGDWFKGFVDCPFFGTETP